MMMRPSILPIGRKRINLLAALGVNRVIHVTFDDALRATDAEKFVTEILPALGVRTLFAGSDFAFGRGRGGDIDTINALGADIGITASTVCPFWPMTTVRLSPRPVCALPCRKGTRTRRGHAGA